MTTWPLTLPQSFLVGGLKEEGADNVIRSTTSTGPKKSRRRYTATVRPISGSMIMTVAEYLIFKAFYEDTIHDGALKFDMPDDINSGTMTVKFKDKFTANFLGLHWNVNMDLEIQP